MPGFVPASGIRHLDMNFSNVYSYQFYFLTSIVLKKGLSLIFRRPRAFPHRRSCQGDCVDISIDVVKTVVEKRSSTIRRVTFAIIDSNTQFQPALFDFFDRYCILQINIDSCWFRDINGGYPVNNRYCLQLFFDLVLSLFFHLFSGCFPALPKLTICLIVKLGSSLRP